MLNPPKKVADAVLQILTSAILNIRSAACNGDVEACVAQAEHIHNLPELLSHLNRDLLLYYWQNQRVEFMQAKGYRDLQAFEPAWEILEEFLNETSV